MSSKNSAEINVGFPIYGLRFINSKTLLAVGGGGEGSNGIPNKITAIKCHFNATDKDRRLQKFREITLPSNEDSPMCTAVARVSGDDHVRYSIFVGCNQSTQLVKSMNINNNLRKYLFTDEEHLRFLDAVQYDNNVLPESIGEYPKIIHITPDNSVGALMTSKVPSEMFIFDPDSLALILHYKPQVSGEVKDFHLSAHDEGKTLVYVTASVIEAINSSSGEVVSTSTKAPKSTISKLAKYFLSKVRFVGDSKVVVTAALRSGKGAAIFEYDLIKQKISNERMISRTMKGVVAIDISAATGVIACAGNDFSVTLIRTSDLKVIKRFPNLHKFAITSLSFAPNGKRLATGSASNTLNVVNIPAKIGGGSLIGSLFQYLFLIVLVAGLAIFIQNAMNTGDLEQYIELSKKYGGEALVRTRIYGLYYGKIGLEVSQKYGDQFVRNAKHYGKIGYEIAKEKSLEGYIALMEKLNKEEPAQNWIDEVDAHTEIESTLGDFVREVTRDVADLTSGYEGEDLDTASIINDAVVKTISSSDSTVESPSQKHVEETTETVGETVEPVEKVDPIQDTPVEAVESTAEVVEISVEVVESSVESAGESIASAVVPDSSTNEVLEAESSEPVAISDTPESSTIDEKPEVNVSPEEPTPEEANVSDDKNQAGTVDEASSNNEAIEEMVEEVVSAEPLESVPADEVSSAQPVEAEEVIAETNKDADYVQEVVVQPVSQESVEEVPSVELVAEMKADDVADGDSEKDIKEAVEPELAESPAVSEVEAVYEVITEPVIEPESAEPIAEPVSEEVSQSAAESKIELRTPQKISIPDSSAVSTESMEKVIIEPAVESKVGNSAQTIIESNYKPEETLDSKPIVEEVVEPQVIDITIKKLVEATAEPSVQAEPLAAPIAQLVEPVEPVDEPVVEPIDPVVEPVDEPEVEPIESVVEPIEPPKPEELAESVVESEILEAATETRCVSTQDSALQDSPGPAIHDEL